MRDLKKDLEYLQCRIDKGRLCNTEAWSFIGMAIQAWPEAIQRAIAAEEINVKLAAEVAALREALSHFYPLIAGRVAQLKDAGEVKAMEQWNDEAKRIVRVLDVPDSGEKVRRVVEAVKNLTVWDFSNESVKALHKALAELEGI